MTWSLNIAANGRHYAKVELPEYISKEDAIARAFTFANAFRSHDPAVVWEFALTRWQTFGEKINIKEDNINDTNKY